MLMQGVISSQFIKQRSQINVSFHIYCIYIYSYKYIKKSGYQIETQKIHLQLCTE